MKERDEMPDGLGRLISDVLRDLSLPKDPESTFRLKTWTVPLSLETASHWAVEEKARLCISALSAPLLTSCSKEPSNALKTRTKVPLLLAVASKRPSCVRAKQASLES